MQTEAALDNGRAQALTCEPQATEQLSPFLPHNSWQFCTTHSNLREGVLNWQATGGPHEASLPYLGRIHELFVHLAFHCSNSYDNYGGYYLASVLDLGLFFSSL